MTSTKRPVSRTAKVEPLLPPLRELARMSVAQRHEILRAFPAEVDLNELREWDATDAAELAAHE